jgi:hypothetical protein
VPIVRPRPPTLAVRVDMSNTPCNTRRKTSDRRARNLLRSYPRSRALTARARPRKTAQPQKPTMWNTQDCCCRAGENPQSRVNAWLRQGTSDTPRPRVFRRPAPSAAVRRGLGWSIIGGTPSRRLSSIVETPDGLTPSAQRLSRSRERQGLFCAACYQSRGGRDSKRLTTLCGCASWAVVADDRRNTQPSSVIERPNARRADAVSGTSCRHAEKDSQLAYSTPTLDDLTRGRKAACPLYSLYSSEYHIGYVRGRGVFQQAHCPY